MSTVIGVIGIPGTGKSTLMQAFKDSYLWEEHKPVDLLDGYLARDEGIFLMGKYEEGEVFSGTDRLSMAVQPEAVKYLQGEPAPTVIFEGDRLNSVSFFRECLDAGHDLHILILNVERSIREQRYKDRGSDQSDKFIKGRKTKISNIRNEFGANLMDDGNITEFDHETPEDTAKILAHINSILPK